MSELKKGFYLVTADGINTMLRWDGEDWVDMRGIRPCFKEVVQTSYCGENNPVFEQGEPDDEVLGFNGWGFPIEHPPKPTPANKEQIREALVFNLPLYTHPQPRTWVDLTDEETDAIIDMFTGDPWTAVEEIKARLKELNT